MYFCFRSSAGARTGDKRQVRRDRDRAIEAVKSLTKPQMKSEVVQVVCYKNVQVLLKLLDCDVIIHILIIGSFNFSQLSMSKERLILK